MKSILAHWKNPRFSLQNRLSAYSAVFLFIHALILTLSPTVRYRSWEVSYLWSHWVGYLIWAAAFTWLNKFSADQYNRHDQFIIPIVGLLAGWGIMTVWRLYPFFGLRQSIWFLASVVIANLAFSRDNLLLILKRYKYLLLICALALAVLTFFFGTYPGGVGPKLWLGAQGIYFQPSELLKLILIIYLAAYFSEKDYPNIRIIQSLFPTLILVLSSLFILIGQQDMGTALIFIVIYIIMIYTAFGKKRIMSIGLLVILIAGLIGYFFIDLIRIRFLAWILPWLDPQAGSYQIIQSLIAIAAGGLFGTGIGMGSPKVVPIPHSDFIYTSLVEETGFAGAIGLLLLFALLFFRGLIISIYSPNKYYRFLAAGISTYILAQAILIMGGNIRLLPITGVTLPFVSYGGSSLIVSLVCAYILLQISNSRGNHARQDLNLQPYQVTSLLISAGIILVAAVTGWWAIVRSYDLQHRTDNPRRLAVTQFVKRGTIQDRMNNILAQSSGEIGSLQRDYSYPPLTNTLGFIHRRYGLAGLELSLDDYLSGEKGYPSSDLWFNFLLYDQPPPGVDVRLTIDMKIQEQIDEILANRKGSAVVMNPKNGEILAIASHPHYDANQLDEMWQEWQMNEDAPFLNRAVQGAYPIGELISPFILTETAKRDFSGNTEILGSSLFYRGTRYACAIDDPDNGNWQSALINGCPSILRRILAPEDAEIMLSFVDQYGLLISPDIGLPVRSIDYKADTDSHWINLLHGINPIRVNPLQIASAASVFSNEGMKPNVNLLHSVKTAQEGWVIVTKSSQERIIEADLADAIAANMASPEISGWEISATGSDAVGRVSWYAAGTPSEWQGTPVVMALVWEDDEPESLRQAGRALFQAITR